VLAEQGNETMTETYAARQAVQAQAVQAPAVTIGQAVGQAEAVLSKLLALVLAETGTSRQDYLALQRLTALGGSAFRDDYLADLSSWLGIDLWTAGELADSLSESGLLEHDGPVVRFAAAGAELRDRIVSSAGAVTRSLIAPVDPADLEATIRTLRELTARARAVLAAGAGEAA
jgi:hypothetical protein